MAESAKVIVWSTGASAERGGGSRVGQGRVARSTFPRGDFR